MDSEEITNKALEELKKIFGISVGFAINQDQLEEACKDITVMGSSKPVGLPVLAKLIYDAMQGSLAKDFKFILEKKGGDFSKLSLAETSLAIAAAILLVIDKDSTVIGYDNQKEADEHLKEMGIDINDPRYKVGTINVTKKTKVPEDEKFYDFDKMIEELRKRGK